MTTASALMRQDRGWGLFSLVTVAPAVAGTVSWLIGLFGFGLVGVDAAGLWMWLAHVAAAHPSLAMGHLLRLGAVGAASAGALLGLLGWSELAAFVGVIGLPLLGLFFQPFGMFAAAIGRGLLALWFISQMDHVTDLIGLVGLLAVV